MVKTSYHHGNLRQALIAEAFSEVAATGPESFSLRAVARRVGVTPMAVYRHFPDKDALLVAVAAEAAERVGAAMQAALEHAPADPLERFRALGIAYVAFAVEHPQHFRALGMSALTDHEPDPMRTQFDMRESLLGAQDAGIISDAPVDHIMLAARSIIHGLAKLIVEGRFGDVDTAQARQLAINVTAVLGTGLVPRNQPWIDPLSGQQTTAPPALH